MQELQTAVQGLGATGRRRKDSSTSSKPPSSDIVKPSRPVPAAADSPRAPGGQVGHAKHELAVFPPEQVQAGFDYRVDVCPDCGQALRLTGFAPRVVQQVELRVIPLWVEEHRQYESYCPGCDKITMRAAAGRRPRGLAVAAPDRPGRLPQGRLPRLVLDPLRKFLCDVVGLTISRGMLAKVVAKAGVALERPYQELLERLPDEGRLNVDETGHKDRGDLLWTWCFRAELYTLFKIAPHRGADVLLEVLGAEFDGVLGRDCFSAYRRYMREYNVLVQFCLGAPLHFPEKSTGEQASGAEISSPRQRAPEFPCGMEVRAEGANFPGPSSIPAQPYATPFGSRPRSGGLMGEGRCYAATRQAGSAEKSALSPTSPACPALRFSRKVQTDYKTGKKTWFLWDGKTSRMVGKLPPEHYDLPLKEIVSFGTLVKRTEEGWSPRDEV